MQSITETSQDQRDEEGIRGASSQVALSAPEVLESEPWYPGRAYPKLVSSLPSLFIYYRIWKYVTNGKDPLGVPRKLEKPCLIG